MISFIGILGRIFSKIISFLFSITVEGDVTVGHLVFAVAGLGLLFALLGVGKNAGEGADTYQPRHMKIDRYKYIPRHGKD